MNLRNHIEALLGGQLFSIFNHKISASVPPLGIVLPKLLHFFSFLWELWAKISTCVCMWRVELTSPSAKLIMFDFSRIGRAWMVTMHPVQCWEAICIMLSKNVDAQIENAMWSNYEISVSNCFLRIQHVVCLKCLQNYFHKQTNKRKKTKSIVSLMRKNIKVNSSPNPHDIMGLFVANIL